MSKYYAVRKGKIPGIYNNWSDCENQVKGFKGAEYKSFKTKKEAENYLSNIKNNDNVSLKDGLIAYIDGSYNDKNKEYGSGIYFVKDNQEHFYYFKGNDERFIKNRNVAGELMAAVWIMKYCIDKNIKKLHLFYDYAGIEKWAIGEWKTNKELTKLYKKFYDSIKDKLEVNFFKVEAHSGDEKNDIADNLAKKSLQENKIENLLTNSSSVEDLDNKYFTIKFFEKQNLKLLKDYLNKDFEIISFDDLESTIEETFKVLSKVSDYQLRFNYYKTKTLTIQGKAFDVFNSVQLFLSKEYENYKELLEINNDFFSYKIDDIYSDIKNNLMPISFDYFNQDIQNLLITSYGLTKNQEYDFIKDYSYSLIPIMRSIEHYIKKIFYKFGIKFNNCNKEDNDCFKNFDMFKIDHEQRKYTLVDDFCRTKINQPDIINSLEICYNFYRIRHDYAHSNILIGTTKTISNKSNADEIIIKGIELIESVYKDIKDYL